MQKLYFNHHKKRNLAIGYIYENKPPYIRHYTNK